MSRSTELSVASAGNPVRTWSLIGGAIVVFVLLIAFLAPKTSTSDPPLDPNGTGPHGFKGLVLTTFPPEDRLVTVK